MRGAARLASRLLALSALLAAGCTVGPDYVQPAATEVPATWLQQVPPGVEMVSVADSPETRLPHWWTAFGDQRLDALVAEALAGNVDLQRSEQRVLEARALRERTASAFWPQVNSAAVATRSQRSTNEFGKTNPLPTTTNNLWDLGFDALWELDLFGLTRRAVEAAEADIAVAEEQRRDVHVSLVAEVAREYLELRGSQWRLDIANDNLKTQADTLELTRARQAAGIGSELDTARAEGQWAGTKAVLPALERTAQEAIHRLDVLLGRAAGTGTDVLAPHAQLPPPPPRVPIGLPSDLLRRRPDVRAAERALAAATARVGQATAALWPRFSLTGALGLQSDSTGNLFDHSSRYWSLGGGLTWPVLDGGALRADLHFADANAQDALLAWRQVILLALEETGNALVAYGQEQQRRDTLQVQVNAERRAADLATELNEAGIVDFLDVLQAQSDRLIAEELLAVSQQNLSENYVALCKALGGGWDDDSPPPVADAEH